MAEKFDVIIVGAGPAGIAAALVLARAGLETVVFERGEYPGSKNVMGGVLYSTVLEKLIPNFLEEAPLERHVTSRKFSLLSREDELSVEFRSERFNEPPYNHSFTVLRARFDPWFARKAEEAGAVLLTGTVVDEFLVEDGRVTGARVRREGGEVCSDVVIDAEGANPILAEKAGLHPSLRPVATTLAVKEVLSLPREVIDERFHLEGDEGTAHEYYGEAVKGMSGSAFIYTNKDTLSIGLGCPIAGFTRERITPNELLESFKDHPSIRRLLKGAEPQEYLAHQIPEGGYGEVPKLITHGLILVGDAAGLVNPSLYHEGSNLAMASGVMAAETVIEAKRRGDFSPRVLGLYVEKLKRSFVLKDLKKYRRLPEFLQKHPRLFNKYPYLFPELVREYLSVSEMPKEEVQRRVRERMRKDVSLWGLFSDAYGLKKAMF